MVNCYKNNNNELQPKSICIIFADLEHDTNFVHKLQKIVNKWVRENLPSINSIEYFSDGSAGQYKNYKNFLNLGHQKKDFQLDATSSFLATSHGNSLYDGIGASMKRKIMRASLQRHVRNQILSFDASQEFCKPIIEGMFFIGIDKEEMVGFREELEERYSIGSTVPGTRICNHFQPMSVSFV